LDKDDLEKLEVVAGITNEKSRMSSEYWNVQALLSYYFLFFNERFLGGQYRCWSFRACDSRTFGIPLGLMVKKDLKVKSVDLVDPRTFSSRGIIVADIVKDDYEFTLILVHLKSKIERRLGESVLKRNKQAGFGK